MEISDHGTVALMALLLIFPAAMFLFGSMKAARAAALLTFIVALYGPEGAFFKFPLVPHLGKENLHYVVMIVAALTFAGPKFLKNAPGFGPEIVLFLSVFTALATANTNPEPLSYGSWITITLPGLNFKDGMSLGLTDMLVMAIPFMLGRTLVTDREDLRMVLKALVGVMLTYTLWIYIELKMSPLMNVWLYGYFAHTEFSQVFRWGGYRPMVFMQHGLALSLLVCHACIVIAAAKRAGFDLFKSIKTTHLLWFMLVTLVLCKSSGSIVYALVLVPLILKAPMMVTARLAQVLAVAAVVYPYLRAQDLVPVDQLVEFANNLSTDRALSLKFRFDNEALLLEKAQQKLWWGWGGYGRNSIYHEEMGKETTIADGAWIIIVGIRGVVCMVLELGVPAYAAVVAVGRLKKIPHEQDRWLMLGLICMLALGIFDLIPNGLFSHYPFFVAGAVYGLARGLTSPRALRAARSSGGVSVEAPRRRKKKKRGRRNGGNGGYASQHTPPPMWPHPPTYTHVPPPPVANPSVAEQDELFADAPSDTSGVHPGPLPDDHLFVSEDHGDPPDYPDDAETIVPTGPKGPKGGGRSD